MAWGSIIIFFVGLAGVLVGYYLLIRGKSAQSTIKIWGALEVSSATVGFPLVGLAYWMMNSHAYALDTTQEALTYLINSPLALGILLIVPAVSSAFNSRQ